MTAIVHVERHLALIASGAQLRQLVGLGFLRPGARLEFGPGHDEKRHADDLARFDPFSEAPRLLGLKSFADCVEFVGVSVVHLAAFVPEPFRVRAPAPASRPRLVRAAS